VDALDCGSYVAALELNLDLVRDCGFSEKRYTVVARYPTVPFDLSIIVPESVSHAELHQRILGAHPEWIRSADCTAVYRGDPIPEGEKSMTYRIVFQSDEATLEMEEVNEVVNGLVTRLGDELGGWLRT
jgi:phenylalanyl-tRNA synthetase beta chain